MSQNKIGEMLRTNAGQKAYYEVASGSKTSGANGWLTNSWRRLRSRAFSAFTDEQEATVTDLHRRWIGDVSGLKVLELGVGRGSALSEELAFKAREYVAVDLSEARIGKLRRRLRKMPNARLYAADFLAKDFAERDFDVIYALAVFHHFEHFEDFLGVVESRLAPGGRVVTRDPVGIWWPVRLLRAAYRPFQTDADWEWPFTDATMDTLECRFEVLDRRGLMRRGKWAAAAALISPALGARLAARWQASDLATPATRASLRSSLQVCYHLRRR